MTVALTILGIVAILTLSWICSKQIVKIRYPLVPKGVSKEELNESFNKFIQSNALLGVDKYSAMVGKTWSEQHIPLETISKIIIEHTNYKGNPNNELSYIQSKLNED